MRPVPSLARRALVALAVLVAFYLTTLLIALALLPIPVLVFMKMDHVRVLPLLVVTACCWVPSGLLVSGLFGVQPRRFSEPGLPLRRDQAPALFAMLDELARAAGTKAPTDVYVSAGPDLFVTETGGGYFGLHSRRVLCIGAPLLATLTAGELRAGLSHELGHYLGGDTRLGGVLAFTEGAFRSVLEATEQNAFHDPGHWAIDVAEKFAGVVGRGLVRLFAGIYLRLTRPMKRRQELAADLLSAELAGRETAIRALENIHVLAPLYSAYLAGEVALAIDQGVMPSDVLAGFARFRDGFAARGALAELASAVRDEDTDPFDTHPALKERVAALRAAPESARRESLLDASARTLLDGPFDLDGWLVDATLTSFEQRDRQKPIQRMPWSEITSVVVPRQAHAQARELAALLHPKMPHATTLTAMLSSVVDAFEAGRMSEMVATVEPKLVQLPPHQQHEVASLIATRTLLVLFQGALLEQGAETRDSLGDPFMIYGFSGEIVRPGQIAAGAMENETGRRELARWTSLLSAAPLPGGFEGSSRVESLRS